MKQLKTLYLNTGEYPYPNTYISLNINNVVYAIPKNACFDNNVAYLIYKGIIRNVWKPEIRTLGFFNDVDPSPCQSAAVKQCRELKCTGCYSGDVILMIVVKIIVLQQLI